MANLEKRPGELGGGHPVFNPLRPDVFIHHHPWVLIVTQTENLRARWRGKFKGGVGAFLCTYDLKDSSCHPPIPKGVVCQLHLWITEF
jgi:hypothetical protein